MRSLILSVLIILALGSCSTYQYVTLNSPEMKKNEGQDLVYENDTLRLTYNFNGKGGPITISVYNKTNQALYVDWNKSAMVRGGHAYSLSNPNVQVSGSIWSYGRRVSYSDLNASFSMPDDVNMIPPSSDISKTLKAIVDSSSISREFLPDSVKAMKGYYSDGGSYQFRRYHFDEGSSPLRFRSYLTFVLGNNSAMGFSISHAFYAGEVVLTREDPNFFAAYRRGGDKMYLKQSDTD